MNIIIDARTLTGDIMGVANFLKLAILEIADQRKDINIFLVTPKNLNTSIRDVFPSNVEIVRCPLFQMETIPKLFWFLLVLPIKVRTLKADVFYSPTPSIPLALPSKVLKVITVHDVVNFEYGATMKLNNRLSNLLMLKRSVRIADLIWVNSNYTKRKVEEYFLKRKSKEIFVGCSVDANIFEKKNLSIEKKKSIKEKYSINDKFILFVGSLEPRKNLSFLLRLMPTLYETENIQLLIVGANGWKNTEIFDIIRQPEFPVASTIFAGFIEVDELVNLYNTANCFISTSLNEGFGMPQLEALMCGCPVISPHNSAMIEVVCKHGITVHGWDSSDWISIIKQTVISTRYITDIESIKSKYNWNEIIKRFLIEINNKCRII